MEERSDEMLGPDPHHDDDTLSAEAYHEEMNRLKQGLSEYLQQQGMDEYEVRDISDIDSRDPTAPFDVTEDLLIVKEGESNSQYDAAINVRDGTVRVPMGEFTYEEEHEPTSHHAAEGTEGSYVVERERESDIAQEKMVGIGRGDKEGRDDHPVKSADEVDSRDYEADDETVKVFGLLKEFTEEEWAPASDNYTEDDIKFVDSIFAGPNTGPFMKSHLDEYMSIYEEKFKDTEKEE